MGIIILILLNIVATIAIFYVIRHLKVEKEKSAQAQQASPLPTAEAEAQAQATEEAMQAFEPKHLCDLDTSILERQSVTGPIAYDAIVGWFEGIELKEHHVAFVARANAYATMIGIESARPASLLVGLYDSQKCSIEKAVLVEADEMDAQTSEMLANDNIVILE